MLLYLWLFRALCLDQQRERMGGSMVIHDYQCACVTHSRCLAWKQFWKSRPFGNISGLPWVLPLLSSPFPPLWDNFLIYPFYKVYSSAALGNQWWHLQVNTEQIPTPDHTRAKPSTVRINTKQVRAGDSWKSKPQPSGCKSLSSSLLGLKRFDPLNLKNWTWWI